MIDQPIVWEWLSFAVRWLHVITAIAWIGSSFYFIALDLSLRKAPDLPAGASGEEWQVHGGGFYHIQKYLVAPDRLPEHLTWFKWESYATWLSGFALLCIVYYAGAELYLIDPSVWPLSTWQAVALSVVSLAVGWIVYDLLCRSRLGRHDNGLMLVLFGVLAVMSWGYAQVFSGKAALLHMGAFTATIMSANVLMVIIPNQKKVVAALKQGRTPDAHLGQSAKQRSTHNNYLTLPVIFLMLSVHYPLAFGSPYNWAIALLVFLMGVSIRYFFNVMHATGRKLWWTWGLTAGLFAGIVVISAIPAVAPDRSSGAQSDQSGLAMSPLFAEVSDVVLGRCSMCHAAEPAWDGLAAAPGGVLLETPQQIVMRARDIYLQAGHTRAMPPGNVSYMEDDERLAIVRWYRSGTTAGRETGQ